MKKLTEKPMLLGLLVGLFLLILCALVPIPMYDGMIYYDQGLVHLQLESKIALSYYFGSGLKGAAVNGILPSHVELKPLGYVLFALIHIGLPALITIRFKMSNARNAYAKASAEEPKTDSSSNE